MPCVSFLNNDVEVMFLCNAFYCVSRKVCFSCSNEVQWYPCCVVQTIVRLNVDPETRCGCGASFVVVVYYSFKTDVFSCSDDHDYLPKCIKCIFSQILCIYTLSELVTDVPPIT